MDNRQILKEIDRIKGKSLSYQRNCHKRCIENGNERYGLINDASSCYISDDFLNALFCECAGKLGFVYQS